MDREFFKNKNVVIMGLGQFGGGLDSAVFAAENDANVTVTDLASPESLANTIEQIKQYSNIQYHLQSHIPQDFNADGETDIIIVNPAIPPTSKFLEMASQAGKLITSQIEIFFQLCPAPIIGITGANGKSTTTALTYHLLEAGASHPDTPYKNVFLGGNIGNKPLLAILDNIAPDDLVVLEISSFQAEQLERIQLAPKLTAITNITPNHLDRHGTFEAYCLAKEALFKYQSLDDSDPAISIFAADDPVTAQMYQRYSNQPGRTCQTFDPSDIPDSLAQVFPLAGKMNLANLAAAVKIAKNFNISDKTIADSLPSFKSLPHRLEKVATVNGVTYYDDSIATTPVSVIAAISAFDQPKILIAGGYDKNIPFDELGSVIAKNAKAAILIGQTADKIANAITTCPDNTAKVEIVPTLADAVKQAQNIAAPGDIVLLSPACASYDMFQNFRQRGLAFKKLVNDLQ